MNTRITRTAAKDLGVGDQFYRGGKLHTVTYVNTLGDMVDLTTHTYSELKRDYVGKSRFVVSTKVFPVIVP